MSASLFALALFACSDDGTACQRLDAPVQTYESMSRCDAVLDQALDSEAARKAEAPTVYAQCLTSRQLASIGDGTIDLTRLNGVQFASAGY
ncbi:MULTISPECIES: hypothetical protein [Novosphingobium]|jgi:hypothetical protein|uniref:Uncharacterized protein n=1 Tax=Novosphingobium panipatense TaxID=428991 RepID=A0ABY1QR76_9SPHN|nr:MULTISPECIES: hypothetical protein [Novosphingobium]SMP78613.1 hypothetical protein SAMN06296065_11160 [Novosphingobium panipatense]